MKATQIPRSSGQTDTRTATGNSVADFGRQQAIVANESAHAMFRGFEAMRKIQEEVAHEASQKHAAAAQRLRGDCSPAEMMAVQSDLLRFDFDASVRYWQELATAALEMQTEIMGCTTHLLNSDSVLEGSAALAAPFRLPGMEAFFPANRRAEAH
jgi:hypothetical protein